MKPVANTTTEEQEKLFHYISISLGKHFSNEELVRKKGYNTTRSLIHERNETFFFSLLLRI